MLEILLANHPFIFVILQIHNTEKKGETLNGNDIVLSQTRDFPCIHIA